jgi:hypothetical protein
MNSLTMLLLLILTISCGGGGGGGVGGSEVDNRAEWTIFIYGHADHNLTQSMLTDIDEMIQANIDDKVKVILAVDLDDSQYGSTFGTKVYEFVNGEERKLLVSSSEENFDDPEVFKNHLKYAFENYPSKKKGIILWNHGGSWDGGFGGRHSE